MAEPEIQQRPEQPYVAIAARVSGEAEFRQAADSGFPALFGWLAEQGIAPAGPPFIRYREFDEAGEPVEIELAAPVAAGVAADGPVRADALPAGRWATLLHVGPYSHGTEPDLRAAHATLRKWLDAEGLRAGKECVEQYRIGPVEEADYSKWETELAYLTS
jgi:effector-binding domain-containing protein